MIDFKSIIDRYFDEVLGDYALNEEIWFRIRDLRINILEEIKRQVLKETRK